MRCPDWVYLVQTQNVHEEWIDEEFLDWVAAVDRMREHYVQGVSSRILDRHLHIVFEKLT